MYRTKFCGELTKKEIGQKVELAGWVHRRRDHGGLIFIDLRDCSGLVQIVFNPEDKELHQKGDSLRPEFVVTLKGKVNLRPKGMANPKLPTGEIEVEAQSLEILNKSKTPPFEIDIEK